MGGWDVVVRYTGVPQIPQVSSPSFPLWKNSSLVFIRPRNSVPRQGLVQFSLSPHLANLVCSWLCCCTQPWVYAWNLGLESLRLPGLRQLLGPHGCYGERMHKWMVESPCHCWTSIILSQAFQLTNIFPTPYGLYWVTP